MFSLALGSHYNWVNGASSQADCVVDPQGAQQQKLI